MASAKDIALKAFRGEKTDYIPVGIFLGGSWPIINSGLTLEGLIGEVEKTAKVFFDVNKKLNADIIITGVGSTALMIKALGGEVKFDKKGAPQIISQLIKNEGDLRSLSVSTVTKDGSMIWLRDTAKELLKLSRGEKLILASGRAPFTLATQMYGLENFSKAMYKNRTFAHEILEFTTKLSIEYFETMIDEGRVDGAFIADQTASGDVISKKHFEEFVLPYFTRVVRSVKNLNKPVMLHICGNISDRLKLISETGIDCLSIDTKVDIAKAMEAIGDKTCIAGNVDPVDVLELGTRSAVIEATDECLRKGTAKGGGFILLPGCDPAGGVPEENITAFVDTAHQWKS